MIYDRIDKTQSPLEIRFLEDCATVGLLVEPQYKVDKIHADFAIPGKKVVIEIDSKEYHSSREAKINDEKRNEIYWDNGYRIVRLPGWAVYHHGEEMAEYIKELINKDD